MFGIFKKKLPLSIQELVLTIEKCKLALPEDDLSAKSIGTKMLDDLKKTIETKWNNEHIHNYEVELNSGEKHEAFIYNYLIHGCANILESGRLHVHRGVLNGQGMSYKLLIDHSIKRCVSIGIYTADWAQANLSGPIDRNIKQVG